MTNPFLKLAAYNAANHENVKSLPTRSQETEDGPKAKRSPPRRVMDRYNVSLLINLFDLAASRGGAEPRDGFSFVLAVLAGLRVDEGRPNAQTAAEAIFSKFFSPLHVKEALERHRRVLADADAGRPWRFSKSKIAQKLALTEAELDLFPFFRQRNAKQRMEAVRRKRGAKPREEWLAEAAAGRATVLDLVKAGFNGRQIAEAMGITHDAARQRVCRAKATLKAAKKAVRKAKKRVTCDTSVLHKIPNI